VFAYKQLAAETLQQKQPQEGYGDAEEQEPHPEAAVSLRKMVTFVT